MGLIDRIKSMLGSSEVSSGTNEPQTERVVVSAKPLVPSREIELVLLEQIANSSQGEFGVDDIPIDAALFDEAYIDSINSVEFLVFIEECYGVSINEMELLRNLVSVKKLAEYIFAERKEAPAADTSEQ